jgi:hypothetical protein
MAAMPSIHVGWALLVGIAMWSGSTSRWRWIGPAHAVATSLVVVWTANHYWLDGIVAAGLLAVAWLGAVAFERVRGQAPAVAEIQPISLSEPVAGGRMAG